jgi:hypothetical protein
VNEIELLHGFRANIPDPDKATFDIARAALMARIGATPRHSRLPGLAIRRRALVVGTAFAITMGLFLSMLVVWERLNPNGERDEFLWFAGRAAQQPPLPPLGPGQFYYLREEGQTQHTDVSSRTTAYSVQIPIVREYWIRDDGWGRIVETQAGEFIWPGPRDKARWRAEGSPTLYGPSDWTGQMVGDELDGGEFTTLPAGFDFDSLPRDPEELYEVLGPIAAEWEPRAAGTATPDPTSRRTFGFLVELLRTPLTPPDVRAALFEAAAYIPGIAVRQEATIKGLGTGAAIIFEGSYCCRGEIRVRWEYLVDPATSQFLGFRETLLDRPWWIDADPPIVSHWMAYVPPRIVDSISERP